MLHFHNSNRMENLVGQLADKVLNEPLSSPFVREQIVVETQGLAQWLKLELARRAGILANVEFPFPRAFISKLILDCVGLKEGEKLIEPEALTWRIMGKLPGLAAKFEAVCPEIHGYLSVAAGQPIDLRRNFQLADRVASLFDQYSVFRPKIIEGWIANQAVEGAVDSLWQSHLWRETMTDGLACQGKFLFDLIQALQNPNCSAAVFPERLTVFCPRSLPPIYLEIFKKLSNRLPVHVFCLCPSEYYWGDIVTPREKERIFSIAKKQGIALDDQKLLLDKIHPLLSSWGRTGRNFQRLLADARQEGGEEAELFNPPEGTTLLSQIQSSIYELDDLAGQAEAGGIEMAPGDRSIQIHACHSQVRELQVLRDQILSWFDEDENLSPEDILVMAPDIEAYAPFLKGIFGDIEPGAPAIPFTQPDRGVRQESPLADAFVTLLQLASGRFSASELIDFFETPAVHRRFKVAEPELAQIRSWVETAAIRWGRGAKQRKELGLPEYGEHSWEYGCKRLVLGYAMADSADQLFDGLLPCSGIEGTSTDLLGRWLDFIRAFFSSMDELSQTRQLKDWAEALNTLLDLLFLPDSKEEQSLQSIRSQVDALRSQQEVSGYKDALPLEVVMERLIPKLQEPQPGKAILRGAVTFSGLTPMRGIPFKAICLLGMQDDAFPRNPVPPSFDLIAQKSEDGDESCRDDDRFLFLESLLAARSRFHVSYVGQSIKDNSVRPPSVVVCELQDFIATRFRLRGTHTESRILNDLVVTLHRLHAFSPAYFMIAEGSPARLFSYSPAQAKVSELISNPTKREQLAPFFKPAAPESVVLPRTVQLAALQSFFQNPSKYFLEKCLELKLPREKESMRDEEPFALDSLEEYGCGEQVLADHFAGRNANLLEQWRGSGLLPHGLLGAAIAGNLRAGAQKVIDRVSGVVHDVPPEAQTFQAQIGGHTIEGQINHYPGLGIVHCRSADVNPAKKAKPHLKLWVEHLLLQLSGLAGKNSWIIGRDGVWFYEEVADAQAILGQLLDLYREGMTGPLPFYPDTSFAYVLEPDELKKLDEATKAWEGGEYSNGDQEDPHCNLCFRSHEDVFGEKFKAVAQLVVSPIVAHHRKASA